MIHFATFGSMKSQRALVLIHGLAVNGSIFNSLVENTCLKDLLLVVPDLRGCGQSKNIEGRYTVNEAAMDIIDIMEELGPKRYVLLGYSQGGTVAQEIARLKPKISGMILANTFANNTRTWREKIEHGLMLLMMNVFSQQTIARLMGGLLRKAGATGDKDIQEFESALLACDKKAMIGYAQELSRFDSGKWLHEINCKTLIIRGEKDKAVPAHHAVELNTLLKNSRLEIIPNAGHEMLWTHEDEFVELVKRNEAFLWG